MASLGLFRPDEENARTPALEAALMVDVTCAVTPTPHSLKIRLRHSLRKQPRHSLRIRLRILRGWTAHTILNNHDDDKPRCLVSFLQLVWRHNPGRLASDITPTVWPAIYPRPFGQRHNPHLLASAITPTVRPAALPVRIIRTYVLLKAEMTTTEAPAQ